MLTNICIFLFFCFICSQKFDNVNNYSLPEGSLLYICENEAMEIGKHSISGTNLHIYAENKENLNDLNVMTQGNITEQNSIIDI